VDLSQGKTGDMFDDETTDTGSSAYFWDGEKYAAKGE
jgi:hypothetical protein